ncbi:hypothetical protein D1007_45665 [Hordeum vulgare]|nr:hypothetical protein D1007_45665 [Hordeum vulgare]
METTLEAMEQQVFKSQEMVEHGLNANPMMIMEFTSNHKMDAIDIGKHLSRLYDTVDQLQGQIYDLQNQNSPKDKIFEKVINPYLKEVLKHPQSIKMGEGMLHIRDVEGPKKIGSVEARHEAMEQQVFKCQGMVERGLNSNHILIMEFTNKHKMDAIDIGKHLSQLYDRVDQLQGQIYDLQNQNCTFSMPPCNLEEQGDAAMMVWLLNNVYDVEHRAYFMSEKKMYDERYTPYIEMTGLLPFVQLVTRSTPNLNAAAVTTLIDRWRPETRSFHLRTGEMTVTLQDVSMITALPIEGKPLCMSTDSEGWRQQMEALIGMSPQEPEVEWQPYGVGPNFGDAHTFELNPLCVQEKHLWLMRCPLICNWAVEFHLPHRVMHQFGFFQPHPPEWVDMDTQLHRLDRRRQRKIKDWHKHHKSYVIMFEQSVQAASSIRRTQYHQHSPLAFNNYLRWFQESTRVEICPPAYEEDILEEPEYDALAQGGYNKLIREGY